MDGERGTVNEEQGMENGAQGTGNREWDMGNGEWKKRLKCNMRLRKKMSPSFMLHGTV